MNFRQKLLPGILFSLLGLLCLATSFAFATEAPVEETEAALRNSLIKHRIEEAANKQRLVEILQQGDGDRTPNQDLFDVLYYDLDIALNTSINNLSGTLTATVEVVGGSMNTLDLNLRTTMSVSAATSDGAPTTYSHLSNILTVDLDRTYNIGETATVTVTYSGNPSSSSFGWDSHAGEDMIWTLSEPFGARNWWPCKDDNSDKPETMDIRVMVPDHLIVASNGNLMSDIDNGDGTRSFHWYSAHPITTYLVSLAIYPYYTYSDWYTPMGGGDPMEVSFFVFPDRVDQVQATYALTVPMIEVFAQDYGEYPFVDEKYGHAMFNWGGGMEHQTCSSLSADWWAEDLISHELAHQWYGDMITCDDFGHIWLNEGFATWSEAYWKEQTDSFETYQLYMDIAAYYGDGTIFVEDPLNDNIFSTDLSYNKGSWVVHMLRHVVGDTNFFDGLAHYRDLYGYGSATTEQLRDAMEDISGLDLDAFFQQWIYGEYFPVYQVAWTAGPGAAVTVVVEQVQDNTGMFTMPIDIRVVTDTGTYDFVVQNSQAYTEYELAVSGTVESVALDPEKWILRQVLTTVSNPTFDEGILLVNGVHWDTYYPEIQNAYEAEAFWGDNQITFWDCFPEPAGGYPSTLPPPLGHGSVPADVIGKYSTVIWLGNDYYGDLPKWQETPISSYLETGGNVILMTRSGANFIGSALADYLGINWAATSTGINDYSSVYLGLLDMPIIGSQTYNDVFWSSVGPNSTLLFEDQIPTVYGTGVHAQPPGGGTHRPEGARFVYMAGRSYRFGHDQLRSNYEFILEHFFGEPWTLTATEQPEAAVGRARLEPNYPNPFNPKTMIPFSLPQAGWAELAVYDVEGRLVKTLFSGQQSAGEQTVSWDGTDGAGQGMASGIYYARLRTKTTTETKAMVLVR